MVEREWREHGAIAVDVGFDEQSSATNAVKVDDMLLVAVDVCDPVSKSYVQKCFDLIDIPPKYAMSVL